ncbi:MAG TPA: thiamine phosphate synthase [Acidimicrobiales bacterium]|nr:thiamine phosphate synthase [Acidimicrobiales bacterium]
MSGGGAGAPQDDERLPVQHDDQSARAALIGNRRLYLCTSDRPDLERFLEACLANGVDLVQLRDKQLEARGVMRAASRAMRVCAAHGVPFILNDRPDLALETGADGVHVGQDDAPPSLARRILGARAIVGLSTHAVAELQASHDEPVDYISAGPVSPTPTKPGRAGTGIGYAADATRAAGRPVFVTGGVDPDTVGPLVAAGVRRFVVVRFLTESIDPAGNARRLRQAIDTAIAAGAQRPN